MAPVGGGNIKVVVRVRPFNNREIERRAKCIVHMKDTQTVLTPSGEVENHDRHRGGKPAKGQGGDGHKTFAFDKSYWSFNKKDSHFAGQDDLFGDLGRPLLDNAFQGYNNCIFAYGQTGSGKSYSMMGYGEEAGVIPRICQDMFERIAGLQQENGNLNCTVEVSYLEIYNERVRDLLNPSTKSNLKVREHPSTGPYVEDLAKLVVRSFQEIENLMDEGNKARTVAATNMNETSSRSHAVFTLTLTQKRHDVETSMDTEKVAKISLVDLAGSERANSTGATGARLKEGAEINRSLSTLGRVIAALADVSAGKKKNLSMVPYRDSILTWLLKDSLGGNSMTAMIAAISPADINYEETLSTLRYADSAKRIKNHAVVNEDPNARMIRELKEELAQLRSKLTSGGGGGGGVAVPADEQYAPDTPLEKQIVSITQLDGTVKRVSKAEIAEQLSQSEKLYKDLNQTWEEKLQKTEKIHKEREAALEELGISIEKGFIGLSTPKKMPHLVNLSDDPLLAECLVYNIKPGTTTVGNVETATTAEIRLNGSKILHEHCTFRNVDGIVTVVPNDNAAVMVNGLRIDQPKRLRSGYRVILGDFHIFRFNHPQEALAERAEQTSLLRHSVTSSQIGSPGPRTNGHERTISRTNSELELDSSAPSSPLPRRYGEDFDWSYARREAARAILGPDQKISDLADEELDHLFEDVQKARAFRRGFPESRLEQEDDNESATSYPFREKYASTGTADSFSADTALTFPSTPREGEADDRLRAAHEEMQSQLGKQKQDFQDGLRELETTDTNASDVQGKEGRLEEALKATRAEMQAQMEQQKAQFEERLRQMSEQDPKQTTNRNLLYRDKELAVAKDSFQHWRRRKYVRMAESILQNAAVLKEAQVMSQAMDKNVVFQFAILDVGHTFASSYDLVLSDIAGEDDEALDDAGKPCVGVRVLDYKNCVIHHWSLKKLEDRVRSMRQMYQYIDRPEYLQHFRLENPFSEAFLPRYSLVGDTDVPLTAVFELKVQDFELDIISPYTSNVVGILKFSLEPSSAEAPSSTLKFNVVMHEMTGFAEREGTEVHAQLFVPGISDEGGATTTQMIADFDEGPVRFESVHSMSIPLSSPRTASLRIAIFAKITPMHLDMLLSWDDMRDSAPRRKQKKNARIPETEFYAEERHDIFSRLQILELSEQGDYVPVSVLQSNPLDAGAFQLHQGLQRRIVVQLTHSSGDALEWNNISLLRVGNIRLVDPLGKVPDLSPPTPDIPLKVFSEPVVKQNANGTSNVTICGQWDSSVHESLLLDRVTADKYRVQMTILWNVPSARLTEPVEFSLDVSVQIQPRAAPQPSIFMQLWSTVRTVHCVVGMFSLAIRPTSAKRAVDLWRMNTQHDYVKGEELLTGWAPRGVSLVRDYIAARKRRRRVAEIETARGVLTSKALSPPEPRSSSSVPPSDSKDAPVPAAENNVLSGAVDGSADENESQLDQTQEQDQSLQDQDLEQTLYSPHEEELLRKYVCLWQSYRDDPGEKILSQQNTEPPQQGAAFALGTPDGENAAGPPTLVAEVQHIAKNPSVLKSGTLLTPNESNTHWVRRHVELRRPYLHVHSVPPDGDGDEIDAINLSNARVDHQPQIAKLLRGRQNVFAIYAPQNTFLFAARTERQKIEWILRIDQSYFGNGNGSGSMSGSEYEGEQ
ncbi:kinesin family protein [Xylona heveae TC161]|uniref:Kinesin family protein n=1 Tax=Xylona heveae (strain CBS 132557 / TC161) TaxID=1328760 RepID=A0A165HMT1_XYLHT|nr:kinesin family protein [Xylona heveae TC161]KZF23746.1 kinesin family protein [Xylona heveae TC161]